jgi:phosphoribosylaminoimidazole-succinocarboxamide synthase
MQKLEKICEGKAKILYQTDNPNILIQHFKDSATAFNNVKKATIEEKGILNNYICEAIMNELARHNIPTHFISRISDREQLVKKVTIIPLEAIVRNVTAGNLAKRLGLEEGIKLIEPIFEIYYKKDELNDPLLNSDHAIKVLKLVSKEQLEIIKNYALKINHILIGFFAKIGINLIDFKLEFGFDENGQIILADEVSPDGCRLWDQKTLKKLDKDIFRRDLGNLVDAYIEVANRLKINLPNHIINKQAKS